MGCRSCLHAESLMRAAVVAEADPAADSARVEARAAGITLPPARMSWARVLKRVFDIDIENCPNCGGALKIIAAKKKNIEELPVIARILTQLGLPTVPHLAPLRGESSYSKGLEMRNRLPTQADDVARFEFERAPQRGTIQRFRPLHRPNQPKQNRNFHQTLVRLTTRRFGDIAPVREKRCLNLLYVWFHSLPLHLCRRIRQKSARGRRAGNAFFFYRL